MADGHPRQAKQCSWNNGEEEHTPASCQTGRDCAPELMMTPAAVNRSN